MERDINCPVFRAHLKKQRKKISFVLKEIKKPYPNHQEIENILNSLARETKTIYEGNK